MPLTPEDVKTMQRKMAEQDVRPLAKSPTGQCPARRESAIPHTWCAVEIDEGTLTFYCEHCLEIRSLQRVPTDPKPEPESRPMIWAILNGRGELVSAFDDFQDAQRNSLRNPDCPVVAYVRKADHSELLAACKMFIAWCKTPEGMVTHEVIEAIHEAVANAEAGKDL